MSSYPTCNKEFQKHSKKFKNTIMASFQVKIGWERPRKRENKKIKKIVPTSSYTTRNRKFQKKKVKKFKKLENTIMASFRAKIHWGRPRKRENKKKNRSDEFLSDM